MQQEFDIRNYLTKNLEKFNIHRIYLFASVELQKLVDDGVIVQGECIYYRDDTGVRCGVAISYHRTQSDIRIGNIQTIKIKAHAD